MKFGIVLPSYMYNTKRCQLADAAFQSLAKTEPLQEETTLLLLIKGPASNYQMHLEQLKTKFHLIVKTDEGLSGTEQTLAFGTQWLFENFGVDYVTWMGDDALFNPYWLWKLAGLIERHPDAVSWSVYRSSFEWIHKTLKEEGEDVLVRSICGHGLTLSKKEWTEWKIDWHKQAWWAPDGDTLDLVHVDERKGERWVTKRSFIQHTSPHEGTHCTANTPEYANAFVAEAEE